MKQIRLLAGVTVIVGLLVAAVGAPLRYLVDRAVQALHEAFELA